MESKCHLGNVIKYDTITKYGWKRGSLTTHPIKVMITQVLHEDWESIETGGRAVPKAELEENCTVRRPFTNCIVTDLSTQTGM